MGHQPEIEYCVGAIGQDSITYCPKSVGDYYVDSASQRLECDRFISNHPNAGFEVKRYEWHLPYHDKWEYIMPVVSKIAKVHFSDFENVSSATLAAQKIKVTQIFITVTIKSLCEAIAGFLDWHEKQKPLALDV